jgi:membrane protease YdiL (CAAX protease family)
MSAKSCAWRAGDFVRSVLPAEPAHWLILVGSTLLYISANLQWLPGSFQYYVRPQPVGIFLCTRLLLVSGAAGFYLALVPRRSQSFRAFAWVFGPALIAFAMIAAYAFTHPLSMGTSISVIERSAGSSYFWHPDTLKQFAMQFCLGFWMAVVGFLLVVAFLMLLRRRRATLPLRLPPETNLEDVGQRQTMRFIWVMISLLVFVNLAANLLNRFLYLIWLRGFDTHYPEIGFWISQLVSASCLLLVVLLAIGPYARDSLRESLRMPSPKYLATGIFIPVALASIWPLLVYAYDRVHWAAFGFAMNDAPWFATYFAFPFWLQLSALFAALAEEIAWRGFLQPRFVRKYGIARGIFLLGLVWGAFHFSFDIHSPMTAGAVAVAVVHRLYMAISLSYVLAWMTIRSRSVLPAALAHGFYNIFLYLPVKSPSWLLFTLWAISAWVLFRYFPVQETEPDGAAVGSALEPAT